MTSRARAAGARRVDDDDIPVFQIRVHSFGCVSQYEIHVGDPVEVVCSNGKKLRGTLKCLTDETFTVTVQEKVKPEGAKRPHLEDVDHELRFDEIKRCQYHLEF